MRKKISTFVLASIISSTFLLNVYGTTAVPVPITNNEETPLGLLSNRNTKEYMKYYFDIEIDGTLSEKQFLDEAKKIDSNFSVDVSDKELTLDKGIEYTLLFSNFDELANTYTSKKATDVLKANDVFYKYDLKDQKNVACALELGFITPEDAIDASYKVTTSESDAYNLLYFIAYSKGEAQNFLGYSNESSIYAELEASYKRGVVLSNDELYKIGSQTVKEGVTTGFNLKSDMNNAKFLPELTLVYGHSSLDHAKQLLGLLESEGIVAKVQFEPKFSIYQYLLEWGPLPEPSPFYFVEEVSEDFYLANSYEYDLALEFETIVDKIKFNSVILEFAKKNSSNPEGKALLDGSWWQPLYTSTIPLDDNYTLIYDNVVSKNGYSIHPFSLPEDMENTISYLESIADGFEVQARELYCNLAFHRYLNGMSE